MRTLFGETCLHMQFVKYESYLSLLLVFLQITSFSRRRSASAFQFGGVDPRSSRGAGAQVCLGAVMTSLFVKFND